MKIKVLIPDYDFKKTIYDSITKKLENRFLFIKSNQIEDVDGNKVDILLIAHEFYFSGNLKNTEFIYKAKENNISVLLLMDGIIEWRNNWENKLALHERGKGFPLYQPVLADKVACIGRNQVRILEHWGNVGKCELVGYPDYEDIIQKQLQRKGNKKKSNNTVRISVMTATTPYFDKYQEERVIQSLLDIKNWLENHTEIEGKKIIVNWRVAKRAKHEELEGIAGKFVGTLWENFEETDILISTPSTITLGAMLYNIPVITLDYTNSPQYISPTWLINHKEIIKATIIEAMNFPLPKQLFQEFVLHENLFLSEKSTERLAKLIDEMVFFNKNKQSYPKRILEDNMNGHGYTSEKFDYEKLFPYLNIFDKQQENYELNRKENFQIALQRERSNIEKQVRLLHIEAMPAKEIVRALLNRVKKIIIK